MRAARFTKGARASGPPSVILSEAKDLMALMTMHGMDGDEMLRFAQHDREGSA